MIFTKKAKQRPISLFVAASIGLSCLGVTSLAAEPYDIDCSKSLSNSGAYSSDVKTIVDTEGSAFTLDEFKAMLNDSNYSGNTVICTFEGLSDKWKTLNEKPDTLNLKYGTSGEKTISVKREAECCTAKTCSPFNITSSAQFATSGTDRLEMYFKKGTPTHGTAYTYSFVPYDSGDSLEVIEAMGLSYVGNNVGVEITATYVNIEDGQTTEEKSLAVGTGQDKHDFFGFEAPEGYYIAKLKFKKVLQENGDYIIGYMYMDDLCLITQEVSSENTNPSRIEITAPDTVETPCYGAALEYNYSVKIFDQFGRELDEEVEVTADNENAAELTESGKLIIKQQTNMPDTITLTATSGEITATKVIAVDKTTSPYYDETKIGVDAYTEYENNREKYDGLTVQTEYTLDEFKTAMEAAAASIDPDRDIAMINFENIGEDVKSLLKISVPLSKDKEKYFDFVSAVRNIKIQKIIDGNIQETSGVRKLLPPSGTHYTSIVPAIEAENNFSFDTSWTGDYRVTSFGFVYLGTGSGANAVGDGFGIQVTFSDGTQKVYGTDQIKGGQGVKEENTFYGIKAPAGHYITNVLIKMQPRVWAAIDNLGFILEVPDILTLKPDYEQLNFSSFCNQDMKSITQDINLPTVTSGGCTIDWTAKTPEGEGYVLSDVIATDETDTDNLGRLNVPETPEKSNVRLHAAMTYGVLTFVRNFDLYVPSKLERDYKKISLPEKTKKNITLPKVGSEFGSTITWKSLDKSLIDDNGKVTQPEGRRDRYCVLQATLTNSSGTLIKEFGVTVEGTGRDVSTNDSSGSGTGFVASGGVGGAAKPLAPVEVKPPVDEGTLKDGAAFNDVPREHWACESITALTEKGIVNGMGDNTFKPEGTVTREQYLSMLVRAFGFTDENAAADFTDVEKDSWYFGAVSVAQSLGICSGYEDGSFGIGKEITREEMAVMAYRSALIAELGIESSDENIAWKDSGEISHFAYDAVASLNKAGVIKGISEEKFSPKTTATRAQAAVIIQRLLNIQRGEV